MLQVMCEEGIRTNTMEQGLLPEMKRLLGLPCGDEDQTVGSGGGSIEETDEELEDLDLQADDYEDKDLEREEPVQKIDHAYIEKLMWDCPYYKGVEINPDMFNDHNPRDRAEISAVRSWLGARGMLCVIDFLTCVFLAPWWCRHS
jgi:hypothetical protein